jgi:hypothetical protein
MHKNPLLAKKDVTLALMVLSGLFRLYKLAALHKLKKVSCKFTDELIALFINMRNREKKNFVYLITNQDPRTPSYLALSFSLSIHHVH